MQLKKLSDTHYVVVTDEPIKPNRWYENDRVIFCADKVFDEGNDPNQNPNNKSIVASTQPLNTKFNDWFDVKIIDLSYIKELLGEVDVEEMAKKFVGWLDKCDDRDVDMFIQGYNQCLEDNKDKRFSEEDMRKAFKEGYYGRNFIGFDDFISFLTQPKDTWEVYFDEKNNLKLK